MSNIEVGEYCRFKNGKISKVKHIKDEFLYFDSEVYWIDGIPVFEIENVFSDFILNHSKNIIDLIKERRLCEWT